MHKVAVACFLGKRFASIMPIIVFAKLILFKNSVHFERNKIVAFLSISYIGLN